MEVRKAYKFRIYPNKEQGQSLLRTIGACRYIYNYYLNIQINAYAQTGKRIAYADLDGDLTRLWNSGEIPWLSQIQTVPIHQSLRALDKAYNNFFRGAARLPQFKSRKASRQSFTKPNGWNIQNGKLHIQRGLAVRIRGTVPPTDTTTKSITVSVTPTGKWYAAIQVIEHATDT
jgi:putative transposase